LSQEAIYIAGVDEAGRGPLAGAVIAAAVILPPTYDLPFLTDSKAISEKKRELCYEQIKMQSVAYAVGRAEVDEIDEINILQASMLAMQRAVLNLSTVPHEAWIDGNRCPNLQIPARAIIKGDLYKPCISAASIIAKVERDREMLELHTQFPEYGFDKHKGYGTKQHMAALKQYGPCSIHRRSFAPVKKAQPESLV